MTWNVDDVEDDQKGQSRLLLSEYHAVFELLTTLRVGALEAGVAAALSTKNQRLAAALQHTLDALKMDMGDNPECQNVEKRLKKLYTDLDGLRGNLQQAIDEGDEDAERMKKLVA